MHKALACAYPEFEDPMDLDEGTWLLIQWQKDGHFSLRRVRWSNGRPHVCPPSKPSILVPLEDYFLAFVVDKLVRSASS